MCWLVYNLHAQFAWKETKILTCVSIYFTVLVYISATLYSNPVNWILAHTGMIFSTLPSKLRSYYVVRSNAWENSHFIFCLCLMVIITATIMAIRTRTTKAPITYTLPAIIIALLVTLAIFPIAPTAEIANSHTKSMDRTMYNTLSLKLNGNRSRLWLLMLCLLQLHSYTLAD